MDIQLIRDIANATSFDEIEDLMFEMDDVTAKYLCALDQDLLGIWLGAAIGMIDQTYVYTYVQRTCHMALWEVGV